ncbi:magnesium transporter [Salisaeta longa]|uniref:magnesium transporter n=1 Tax=Salisaeta longa TaxID=503170 RepID=UPI0003B524F9|nr:magnesium transporter [Salisaeta longa]
MTNGAPTTTRPGGLLEVDEALVDDIAALVRNDQEGMVRNLAADLYPADLALLLRHVPRDVAQRLFSWLPPTQASDTLTELEEDLRRFLLHEIDEPALTDLLDALDTDDAADLLAELPDEVALRVLPALEDTDDLTELLDYGPETAGGLMAREFVAVPPTWTLAEVTEAVRAQAPDVDEMYAAFVVDADGVLLGVVSLKDLLLAPADRLVSSLMEPNFISVTTDIDQEEVARVVQRYDLVSLPVLDERGRLMGRITIDDVVDVIRDEAEEDIQIMSGLTGDEGTRDSVFRVSQGRLPWLLIGLLGSALSGTVIHSFEVQLQQAVVLATFIPVVTAMGGNAAVQSAAIAVQGLSSGRLWMGDILPRITKEMAVALLNGLVIASILCGGVFLFNMGNVQRLMLTIGLTMLLVSLVATTNGALIPFVLKKFGVDPASAMGPFVTTLNDIIGLTLYFFVAQFFYL